MPNANMILNKSLGEDFYKLQHVSKFTGNQSHTLENYECWTRRNEKLEEKLGKTLKREPGDLLMKTVHDGRPIKEEKLAIECSAIPLYFDKYRGNPEWYNLPPGLKNICYPQGDELTHFYQKSLFQKNAISLTEQIGLPDVIQVEKLLVPRTRNLYENWKNSKYRQTRLEQLSVTLEQIVPHKPDFSDLVIIGNRILAKNSGDEVHLTESVSGVAEEMNKGSMYDSSLRLCLRINDSYFYTNAPALSTIRRFALLFDYDIMSGEIETKYITFENIGRATLRILWKPYHKFKLFDDCSKNYSTETFCFDKNMLLLVPGQIINFPIWFRSNKVSNVRETWELVTEPRIWKDPDLIIFTFQAQAKIDHFMTKIKEIKNNVNQKVKHRIIREVLDEVLLRSRPHPPVAKVSYTYTEAELFEVSNIDKLHIEAPPKYIYNKEVISELKTFYKEIRQLHHPKEWNLSIDDLKVFARIRDAINYAEEKTANFRDNRQKVLSGQEEKQRQLDLNEQEKNTEKSKKARTQKSRSKSKASKSTDSEKEKKLTKSKNKTVAELEAKEAVQMKLIKETNYAKLLRLIDRLETPSVIINEGRLKYFFAYSIFCTYFTKMSHSLAEITQFYDMRFPESNYSSEIRNCDRFIFEYFDSIQSNNLEYKKELKEADDRPKCDRLKDISSDDVQTIYGTYFGLTADDVKKNKDLQGKQKKKSGSPEGKKDKASKEMKSKSPKGKKDKSVKSKEASKKVLGDELVNFDFDPYAEEFIPISDQPKKESLLSFEGSHIQYTFSKNEKHRMYCLVHYYLGEAIDAVVDMLESYKHYQVPIRNLTALNQYLKLLETEKPDETTVAQPENALKTFENEADQKYFETILDYHFNAETQQTYFDLMQTECASDRIIVQNISSDRRKIVQNISSDRRKIVQNISSDRRIVQNISSDRKIVRNISSECEWGRDLGDSLQSIPFEKKPDDVPIEDVASIFTIPKIEEEVIRPVENYTQTSSKQYSDDEKKIDLVDSDICLCPTEFNVPVVSSTEAFYYSDDENFSSAEDKSMASVRET